MATPDPMETTHPDSNPAVSQRTYVISGLLCTVYGLDELPPRSQTTDVAVLWLLHPRLSAQKRMEAVASHAVTRWNQTLAKRKNDASFPKKGLIAVSFDQRNHGSRLIEARANEAWRNGNPLHGQDMYTVYRGTVEDTSNLITFLPAYVFPEDERSIVEHMALGVSLGGYACWQLVVHEPRITTVVIVVGCADYVRVMSDRARLTKLPTYTHTNPPGSTFLGSKDFPKALLQAVKVQDAVGYLIGKTQIDPAAQQFRAPTEAEKRDLLPAMKQSLSNKRIFTQSGGSDKLVPYRISKPFIDWLKHAVEPGSWFGDSNFYFKDRVYDGVGHAMSPEMAEDALQFIVETLSIGPQPKTQSKI